MMVFDPFISLYVRTAFALLFILAAMHKLRSVSEFSDIVKGYNIVPLWAVAGVGIMLPLFEAFVAAMLLLFPVVGIAAASALLTAYGLVIAFNIARGNTQIDCGCSWGSAKTAFPALTWALVLRNILLVIVLAISLVPTTARAFGLMDAATLGLVLCFTFFAGKAGFTLVAVYNRMREVGHV